MCPNGISSPMFSARYFHAIFPKILPHISADEHDARNTDFDYAKMSDADVESARAELVQEKGFFILPSLLFCNICARAAQNKVLHET